MAPFGITQILVIGELDPIVPKTQATSFAETALQMGDSVEVVEIAGAGHFELVDPTHAAYPSVRDAVLAAIAPGWSE
jgi:alpha-beta hydrolase superfamily lysophospholipase